MKPIGPSFLLVLIHEYFVRPPFSFLVIKSKNVWHLFYLDIKSLTWILCLAEFHQSWNFYLFTLYNQFLQLEEGIQPVPTVITE